MRTNRASWNEEGYGTPLGRLLVAPQRQLAPQAARSQSVSMPTAPPASLRYGSVPPGIARSQRFTGGVVQRMPGAAAFNAPPDFVGPSYPTVTGGNVGGNMGVGNMGVVHPVVATLAALLGVGGGAPPPPIPPQNTPRFIEGHPTRPWSPTDSGLKPGVTAPPSAYGSGVGQAPTSYTSSDPGTLLKLSRSRIGQF